MKTARATLYGLVALFTISLALGASLAIAQPAEPEPPADDTALEEPPEDPAEMRQRIRQRIRLMRAWRLTEVVELDETTAVQLFDHLDAFDELIFAQQERLGELGRELRQGIADETTDPAVIRALVEEITATHLRVEELRVRLVVEAGTFLDARQQAALMLFIPEFDRQIQTLMREARRERGEYRERSRRERRDSGMPPGSRRRGSPR